MATVAQPQTAIFPPDASFADLQRRLGDVPLSRIRLSPPPGAATVDDVVSIEVHEDRLFELVDRTLVEKPMGAFESAIAVLLTIEIGNFVRRHKLGKVLGSDGMMQIFPNLVRIPDVSFLSWNRLPREPFSTSPPAPQMAPDLAVEVLLPSNTRREMQRKLQEYFAAGVRLVWYVDPATRTAISYTAVDAATLIPADGQLEGGDVLPGFGLSLTAIFDEASEQGPPK